MISNSSKRFPTFVANRLAKIDELSKPNQWRYVTSALNPADDATRGLTASNLSCDSRWIRGPEFLFLPEQCWPEPPCQLPTLPPEFSILQRVVCTVKININNVFLTDRFACFHHGTD